MTTYDPDTLEQDNEVLKEIVRKFHGKAGAETVL